MSGECDLCGEHTTECRCHEDCSCYLCLAMRLFNDEDWLVHDS